MELSRAAAGVSRGLLDAWPRPECLSHRRTLWCCDVADRAPPVRGRLALRRALLQAAFRHSRAGGAASGRSLASDWWRGPGEPRTRCRLDRFLRPRYLA